MKYAVRFYRGNQALREADEVIIRYDKKTSKLLDFVKMNSGKRIIANIGNLQEKESSLEIFYAAASIANNFTVLLSEKDTEMIKALRENNVKFFFIEGADSWDDLESYIKDGVSDVYVVNELGFDLVNVSKFCHEQNVNIRVFPNVAQSSMSHRHNLDTFRFFFIRPEDIDLYDDYVDIYEFFGPIQKQNIVCQIYKSKKWIDSLNYLILGLELDINSNMIAPGWAERRLTCQKKCRYAHCKICKHAAELGEVMRENGYQFREGKVDNEHTIINAYLQNESEKTSLYDGEVSEEELSESYY